MRSEERKMRTCKVVWLILAVVAAVKIPAWAQHEGHSAPAPPMGAPQHQHPPAQAPAQPPPQTGTGLPPSVPPIGASQQAPGPKLTLQELEEMALKNNPTLLQAEAEIRAARGRRLQAGLYPNPRVGYTGEEIRGGSLRGGQQGAFIEQTFVLGGKLGLSRKVFDQEIRLADIEAEEQRLRVRNAVRLAYYRVLAAQELLETERGFARLTADALETSRRLLNIGQADQTEVTQAEIELQRMEIDVIRQENRLHRQWSSLAALVGNPRLPLTPLAGNLAEMPAVDEEQLMRALVEASPATRIADTNVARADAMVARARREPIPDLQVRGGLQQNRELLEATGRPVGLQGFAEVGIQIPIFNRNQGNVEAARAGVERARQEASRVRLALFERGAGLVQRVRNARVMAERYRDQVQPRAQRAYEAMLHSWGMMQASYPQLLLAQRTLFEVQRDYIGALEELRTSAIALEGFMLTDGLEAPARPGEVDMPVRELNLPMSRGDGGEEQ